MGEEKMTAEIERLEEAIERAGRDRVFAAMRAAGWTGTDQPPVWAWWEACRQVSALGR
jgi:hypothetical protein